MATKRINNGTFTAELASGDFVVAVSQIDATGAAVNPGSAPNGTPTDKSVTITAGGAAQVAAALNASRHYLFIQNPSGSGGSLWFSVITTAVAASPSVELQAGASYENPADFCPTGAVSVIHGTTGAKITVLEG